VLSSATEKQQHLMFKCWPEGRVLAKKRVKKGGSFYKVRLSHNLALTLFNRGSLKGLPQFALQQKLELEASFFDCEQCT
jgi:hypothetical protein